MALRPFQTVPDWASVDNQGAGVAVANLGKDGKLALLVLRVDALPAGPNHAFYRVGQSLQPDGSASWDEPWIEIPDWDSAADSGASLAVADFGVDGLGLVVLQVRSGGGASPNEARYRVGPDLDASGKVTGDWSSWVDIPDWGSFRDQGVAVAAVDLDADGQPELVVFHIDDFHTDHQDPGLPNKGLFRVGRKLTPDGAVATWNPWQLVDWDSWFNQGAGMVVADLAGTGNTDLVIFQIDNPPGENSGKYRVGWNVDVQGNINGGWGPWTVIDGWDSWEDAGGGIALASFAKGQRPKAVVLHVDNPPGVNEGRLFSFDLELDIDEAAAKGIWRLVPYYSQVLPVHAALLHTGDLLFFSGSGNNIFRRSSPEFGNEADGIYTSVVWNVSSNSFQHPATLRRLDGSVVDYFCCGHCRIADGRLLVAGGSAAYDKVIVDGQMQDADHGFTGLRDAMLFDPGSGPSGAWTPCAPMTHARWYPTLLALTDGRVIATSGLDDQSQPATAVEMITNPASDPWTSPRDFGLPLYPHLFLTHDGQVLFTGGKMDTAGNSTPLLFDPLTPTQATLIGGLTEPDKCNQSASDLLPPAQKQQFMILGGGPADEDGQPRQPATTRTAIVDLLASIPPTYTSGPDLNHERMHVNAVLLPDSTVLATGGGVFREATANGQPDPNRFNEIFEAEIYDPTGRGGWTSTAPASVARLYHSVALLLPDGRVVAAGGNPDKGRNVPWLPPEDPMEEMRIEVFSPPYLFKATAANPRPAILQAPKNIGYGTAFDVETASAKAVNGACLVRPGLTTHSFNVEQRLVELSVSASSPATLSLTLDTTPNVAPPGWYMLFLISSARIPSVAAWVQLT